MLKKIKGVFGSLRFWMIVVIALLQGLEQMGVIDSNFSKGVVDFITLVFGTGIAVRTVDKLKV